jgi:hypothetical protein
MALALNWGSVPDWLMAAAAFLAVYVAWVQLKKVADANRQQANVARADLMLKIDQIFEGLEMAESRLAVRTLRNQCEAIAKAERLGANDREIIDRSAELFSDQLTKLFLDYKTVESQPKGADADLTKVAQDKAGPRYAILMRLPYWMETVGLLTKKQLLNEEDVLDLYDAVYTGVLTCYEKHILDRRDEKPDRNDMFLVHATWLLAQARQRATAKRTRARLPSGKPD